MLKLQRYCRGTKREERRQRMRIKAKSSPLLYEYVREADREDVFTGIRGIKNNRILLIVYMNVSSHYRVTQNTKNTAKVEVQKVKTRTSNSKMQSSTFLGARKPLCL